MATYLFRIAETFDISDRGRIVASDTKIIDIPFMVRAGSKIELRFADGSVAATSIKGLEHSRPFSPYRPYAFLVGDEVQGLPLPTGTEVWLLDEGHAQ